jgi:hypothetical protein
MSPETVSSTYPREGRPIAPLPKRRLRERLSPDVAESIKYPPAPATTAPLFYYPYSINGEEDARGGLYPVDRQRSDDIERNYISRRNGEEIDSDEDYIRTFLPLCTKARFYKLFETRASAINHVFGGWL